MATPPPSTYLQHLPELFRNPPGSGAAPFVGQFLNIFEALLSGRPDAIPPAPPGAARVRGLEEILEAFVRELDPASTTVVTNSDGTLNSPFLTYLASWVALTLDQNWDLGRKRLWLQRIVLLYQRRGTREGLAEYLAMFVGDRATVVEPPDGIILADPTSSILGVNTFLAPAYYFRVQIRYGFPPEPFDIGEWNNIQKGTQAIVDLEKPAHTYYTPDTRTPGIILALHGHAVVGRETLIWGNSKPF